MKQINITKMIMDNALYYRERQDILGMEFIKQNDGNYIIKGSNNIIVSEKEKKELERDELIIEDITSSCAKHITPKLTKVNKEINEDIKKTKSTKK